MQGASRLRLRIRQLTRGKQPRGRRYPASLRAEVVALARARQAEGVAVARIARELGLGARTLALWMGRERPALRRVRLVREPEAAAGPGLPVVHTPTGLRVEGLDLDSVVRLLRALA